MKKIFKSRIFGNKSLPLFRGHFQTFFKSFSLLFLIAGIFPPDLSAGEAWSLDSCISYAVSHNINVKNRHLNVVTGELDITEAKDNFLPNVSAGASQSFSFGRGLTADNMYANRNTSQFGWSMQMSMPVFQGLRNVRTLEYAKTNYRQLVEQWEAAKDDVTLAVIAQYLQVLYYQEIHKVALQQLELSNIQLKRQRDLLEAGKIPELDILQAEAQVAQDELTSVTSLNDFDLALLDLAQLLELDSSEGFFIMPLSSELEDLPLPSPEFVFQQALATNHTILSSRLGVDVAAKYLKLMQSGYLPSLSFSAGFGSSYYKTSGYENETFGAQMRHNLSESLGFSLNIPIFDAFSTRNSIRKAKVQQISAQLQLEDAELQLYKTIKQAHAQAVAADKRMKSSAIAEKSTGAALDAMREKYNYGKANATEFEQAKTSYIQAVSESVQAKYESVLRRRILQFYYDSSK
ncbi:MAG: TolC family protein [Muribaculaceae bacterium]|nr:TolC family protein [Muribaculaceae bacterium]